MIIVLFACRNSITWIATMLGLDRVAPSVCLVRCKNQEELTKELEDSTHHAAIVDDSFPDFAETVIDLHNGGQNVCLYAWPVNARKKEVSANEITVVNKHPFAHLVNLANWVNQLEQ